MNKEEYCVFSKVLIFNGKNKFPIDYQSWNFSLCLASEAKGRGFDPRQPRHLNQRLNSTYLSLIFHLVFLYTRYMAEVVAVCGMF